MDWSAILGNIGLGFFIAAIVLGALVTLFGLPGTVVILAAAVVYSALTAWSLPWWLIGVLAVVTVVAEVSDNIISAAGVKKYGGSTEGMFFAMLGGLVGAIVGGSAIGALVPVVGGIIGPIAGGLAGGFLGGYWYELRQGKSPEEAKKAGFGAVMGRLAGAMLKCILAVIMVIMILMQVF